MPATTSTSRPGHISAAARTEVPAELTHKRNPDEALLRTVRSTPGGPWEFTAVVPRTHSANRDHAPDVPILTGLELVRQLGIATAHLHGNVPLDTAFVLNHARFTWTAPHDFDPDDTWCTTIEVHLTNLIWRGKRLNELTATAQFQQNGRTVARGAGKLTCIPGAVHDRLRQHARSADPPPAAPLLNNTLIDTRGRILHDIGWPHPDRFLFDHLGDHYPGMLLAEAAVHSHRLIDTTAPTSLEITCHQYAELDRPVRSATEQVIAEATGRKSLTTFTQDGTRVAEVTVGTAPGIA